MANVLVLEPDPDLRVLAADALAELGHHLITPDDADTGARVDVVMRTCAESRGEARGALSRGLGGVPVVCIGDEPLAVERRCHLTAPYLVRPYPLDVLGAALSHALVGAHAR